MKPNLRNRIALFAMFVLGPVLWAPCQIYCNGEPITEGAKYVILSLSSPFEKGMRVEAVIDHGQARSAGRKFEVTTATGEVLQWRSIAHLLTWMDNQGWEYFGATSLGLETPQGSHLFKRKMQVVDPSGLPAK